MYGCSHLGESCTYQQDAIDVVDHRNVVDIYKTNERTGLLEPGESRYTSI